MNRYLTIFKSPSLVCSQSL
uniref:Uncharacterized protein n=1 Tax=Arundo donax TaxID=35708 RepID=A0A0A8Z436_ARUDO